MCLDYINKLGTVIGRLNLAIGIILLVYGIFLTAIGFSGDNEPIKDSIFSKK